MRSLVSMVIVGAVAGTAAAQPAGDPAPDPAGPLGQVRDEKQLSEALSSITQDPAIQVDDPKTRSLAQALMVEGVKQLQAKAYDQALANFLDAYAKFPSPKILLNIASTLRDMGRLADAANTYQRYLIDPATGAERVGEVKELLIQLDEQLTILTVRVYPSGSELSIDAGPFIPVGTALVTRVRPGIHLVRVKAKGGANEVSINGFEGENKEVPATVKMDTEVAVVPDKPPPTNPDVKPTLIEKPPEKVDGWLITGTQYGSNSGSGNARSVRAGFQGPEVRAIVPRYTPTDDGGVVMHVDTQEGISSGVIAALRIDGEGRGAAVAIGLAIARGKLEAEIMFLRSNSTGGYLGLRYRFLTGFFRPYLGLGVPGFAYDDTNAMGKTSTKLAVGLRGAGGLELYINGHLSVQADVGYEHFFVDQAKTGIDANVLVPTVGVIGRL